MTAGVALGAVFRRVERRHQVDPQTRYPMMGVRSFGRGCFAGPVRQGADLSYSVLHQVRSGDFVYPKLMAWEGAFAFVDDEFDGYFVSPEFCIFRVITDRAQPRYLAYVFRYPPTWRLASDTSRGVNLRRRRLRPETFLAAKLDLPDVASQRRVVANLDRIFAQTADTLKLAERLRDDVAALPAFLAHRPDLDARQKVARGWKLTPLQRVLTARDASTAVRSGEMYPNVGIRSFGGGLFWKEPIDGTVTKTSRLARIAAGQFIYSRLFAFEGAFATVDAEYDGAYVSTEFPVFHVEPSLANARFLAAYFARPHVWQVLNSRGLGLRRQRLPAQRLLQHEVWLPPAAEQQRIAETIGRCFEAQALTSRLISLGSEIRSHELADAFSGKAAAPRNERLRQDRLASRTAARGT